MEVVGHAGALALGSLQQRTVLALLLIRAPDPLSRDRLIDELWGDHAPPSAGHALQVYVSRLRGLLRACDGDVIIRSATSGYAVELEPQHIDARRFERLIEQAQGVLTSEPARAHECFKEAVTLWRGAPLAEFHQSELAHQEANRLDELHTLALEGLVESRLASGQHAEVVAPLTALVAGNPLRERPRRLLMLALYRCGRHAEALAAYRDAVSALDEIGLAPGPDLRQLEQAILAHDTTLSYPSAEHPHVVGKLSIAADPGLTTRAGCEQDRVASDAGRPVERRAARKLVTALFCDVTGSTALGEQLDPETLHDVMNHYFAELRSVIERHGGTVAKFIGDAVVAVFGIPRVREDDALRAVRAAAEIRTRLPAVALETGVALTFRTGVNTGIVLVGESETLAVGDAMNVAARLQQAAAPGEILLGAETVRLVRDAVTLDPVQPLVLKGKAAPVPAVRLLAVDPLAPGRARHFDAPMVGRERELALLMSAWERSVRQSGCHLFTLLGAAGVGKSRLVGELLAHVGAGATTLQGRCLHYGEGITFWPLLEALGSAGPAAEPVIERLTRGGAATPEELYFAVRRLLEELALQRPVIVHVDDVQWAEAMLLDLLDHIVELSRGAPILLLCSGRPELLEERPTWGGGKLNATTVLLEPLSSADCEEMLDALDHDMEPGARTRVIDASEGNPLFLEEMAALIREGGGSGIPSTIQALLAARLELLSAGQRDVLECAAIEGEVFHARPLHALVDRRGADVEEAISGLVRKELIRPHASTLQGDHAFRFRHLLIRDAAYDSVPKAIRLALHDRFAQWLEAHAAELPELDEISGWHLEQAVRYQRELARRVDPGLPERAAAHLHAAGRRASRRGDVTAAVNLLERALSLAPQGTRLEAEASVDLAERLIDIGDLARVDVLLEVAEGDDDVADLGALTRFEWLIHAQPHVAVRTIEARLPRILDHFHAADDPRGLAKAHMAASQVHWLATQATAAGRQLRLAADYAGRAGDGGMRSRALAQYLLTLIYGRENAATLAREIAELSHEELGPYLTAFLDVARGELARLRGDVAEARRCTQTAIAGLGALGMGAAQGGLHQDLGQIELSAGEPSAALEALERSDAILAALGERSLRSSTQALMAEALAKLGAHDRARAAVQLSDELSAPEDVLNGMITHRVRAHLALAQGDNPAAERWARDAVAGADQTDFIRDAAHARLDLAVVLLALGRTGEAVSPAREALALYEAKGDELGRARARSLLQQLLGPA